METVIYSTINCDDLKSIEAVLTTILIANYFKRIEQGTVLLYDDGRNELSIETHNNSYYLSGRIKNSLLASHSHK